MTTPHQLPETFFTACANVTGAPREQKMAVDVLVDYCTYIARRELRAHLWTTNKAALTARP